GPVRGRGGRVGVDATPLRGVRTGIGRSVSQLRAALAGQYLAAGDPGTGDSGVGGDRPLAELRAAAFTWRGQADLAGALPPGVTAAGRRAPARALQALWARAELPRGERRAGGGLGAFPGPNFVLAALRRAGRAPPRHGPA